MIDVVYVLGSGSIWNNNEIRFSLRSLEKNLQGFRNIWVVGIRPEWIRNIRYIEFGDELKNNADGNIARKLLRVCQEEDLTDDFLFINDDHFVIKPVNASDIPPFHKGDLSRLPDEYFQHSFWRGRLFRTRNILISKHLPALHYDCHAPMVINKQKFPQAISQFDFEKNIGYTMKSLYGNVIYGKDGKRLNGEKVTIFKKMTTHEIKRHCIRAMFVAVNNAGLNASFKEWLYEVFPDPSRYEAGGSTREGFIEIIDWLNGDKDYAKGSELFVKYGKSRKIKKFISKHETMGRQMKLEHHMKELLNYL